MDVYRFRFGRTPLLVSMPHAGTHVPADVAHDMTSEGREVPDTDWHMPELYDFLQELDATVLIGTHSRYVIDLNRPPDNRALYVGSANTELCPSTRFDNKPIWRPGCEPDPQTVHNRIERFWKPYHQALENALLRKRERFGYALLFEAHSIASRVPRFFEGDLTDFNFGTNDGQSLPDAVAKRLLAIAQSQPAYSSVLNGRFKGGYITRHYGRPAENLYAVQLELSQRTYMLENPPFKLDAGRAAQVRPLLRRILETYLAWSPL